MIELLIPILIGIGLGVAIGFILKDKLAGKVNYYEYIRIPTQNEAMVLTFDEKEGIIIENATLTELNEKNINEGRMPLLKKGDTSVKLGTYIIKEKNEQGEIVNEWKISFPIIFRYKDTIIDPSLIDCLKEVSLIVEKYEKGELEKMDPKIVKILEDIREKLDLLVKIYSRYSDLKVAYKSLESHIRQALMKKYYEMTSELERILRGIVPLVPWFLAGIIFTIVIIFTISNVNEVYKENADLKAKLYWFDSHYAGPPPPWKVTEKNKKKETSDLNNIPTLIPIKTHTTGEDTNKTKTIIHKLPNSQNTQ